MSKNPFYRRKVDQSIINRLNSQNDSWKQSPRSYSPWRPAREAGILTLNPPSEGDIREDPRYQQLKKDAYSASPYHKQLLDLQMRRLAQLESKGVNNITFDYDENNQNASHKFDPNTRSIYINANDRINNPANSFNHEGYHALSFLDNKNYRDILKNMRNQNFDPTTWNTVKQVIEPKGTLMRYALPNMNPPNPIPPSHSRHQPLIGHSLADLITKTKLTETKPTEDDLLADEIGGYTIENADNLLSFQPGTDVIKPFLSNEAGNIKKIYRGYDPNNEFPIVHSTLGDLLKKIESQHTPKSTAISISNRDTKKREHYKKILSNNQQQVTNQNQFLGNMFGQQQNPFSQGMGEFGSSQQNPQYQSSFQQQPQYSQFPQQYGQDQRQIEQQRKQEEDIHGKPFINKARGGRITRPNHSQNNFDLQRAIQILECIRTKH